MTMPTSDERRDGARLAPVTPLFGESPSARHPARRRAPGNADPETSPVLRALTPVAPAADDRGPDQEGARGGAPSSARARDEAEQVLLRKLRNKALSVAEARLILRGQGLAADIVDEVIIDCEHRGYLDDRVLAELLVRAGVERRGQGRIALARALAQRGLSRELIDAALAELPDDDAERALEYARSKARAMSRLDHDTALRRLVGQLARRGFEGSQAFNAAKQALREAGSGPTSGVRFQESDE